MSGKATKSGTISIAEKLGYKVEVVGSRVHLIKGEKRLMQKSFNQAYHYLYMKDYRARKKLE